MMTKKKKRKFPLSGKQITAILLLIAMLGLFIMECLSGF